MTTFGKHVPRDWRLFALCAQVDPDAHFPEGLGPRGNVAKSVCAACSVRRQCLEFALENNERDGVWGGLSTTQRAAERRRRKMKDAPAAAPLIEDTEFLIRAGVAAEDIAVRLGKSAVALGRACRRAGRPDLAGPFERAEKRVRGAA